MHNNTRHRALIVDDSPYLLMSLKRLLAGMSDAWEILFSDSPVAALELMREEPVDVLITDQQMPVMIGSELVHKIHQLCPKTTCIIMTGSDQDADQLRKDQDVKGVLLKPCTSAEMRSAIINANPQFSNATTHKMSA